MFLVHYQNDKNLILFYENLFSNTFSQSMSIFYILKVLELQENSISNTGIYVPHTISMYLVVISKLVPDTYIF